MHVHNKYWPLTSINVCWYQQAHPSFLVTIQVCFTITHNTNSVQGEKNYWVACKHTQSKFVFSNIFHLLVFKECSQKKKKEILVLQILKTLPTKAATKINPTIYNFRSRFYGSKTGTLIYTC